MRKLTPQAMWLYAVVIWMAVPLIMTGCASSNPIKAADTAEQKAYAAYGTFVIFQEKAVDLAELDTVSNSIKLRIIDAENRAKPVADSLLDAINEYNVIRAEVDAGETSSDRLVVVSNNLNSWINRLMPLVNELVRNVKGAR
jgi:hypothetical protein